MAELPEHRPRLVRLDDERFAVRCRECEQLRGHSVPIGIGVPITSRLEAESIAQNHGGYVS
jgi:hypothetical protein